MSAKTEILSSLIVLTDAHAVYPSAKAVYWQTGGEGDPTREFRDALQSLVDAGWVEKITHKSYPRMTVLGVSMSPGLLQFAVYGITQNGRAALELAREASA